MDQASNQTSANNIPIQDVRSLRRGFLFWGALTLTFAGLRPVSGFSNMEYLIGMAGPAAWLAIPLLVILLLIVSAVFGELASRWPLEGSVYAWSRQLIGHRIGFVVGWMYLISYLLFMSSMSYFDSQRIFFLIGFDSPSHFQSCLLTTILIVIATAINASKRSFFSVFIIGCAVISFVGVAIFGTLLLGHQHQPLSALFGASLNSISLDDLFTGPILFGLAFISTLCFRGFEMSAEFAEEVRDPRRNIPRAMLLSLSLAGLVFTYAAATLVLALPDPALIAELLRKNPYAGSIIPSVVLALGESLARTLAAMIVIVTFGLATVCQLAASRTLWAMARDREMLGHAWLVRLTNKGRLPANALWTTGLIGAVVPFLISDHAGFIIGGASAAPLFLAFLVPTLALGIARMRGTWQPGPWTLGRWGGITNGLAVIILVGLTINIVWPRTIFYGAGNELLPLLILVITLVTGILLCLWAYREGGIHTRYYSPVNRSAFKRIRLAHTGICITCENPIPAQDVVLWDSVGHQIMCLDCDEKANLSTSSG